MNLQTRDDLCPFCQRISKEQYDFSGHGAVSFEPLHPVTSGHRLFVPWVHVVDAADKPYITAQVFQLASLYAQSEGKPFNLITSSGAPATQSVFHLHVHYIPRSPGDGLHLPWTTHDGQ